MTFPAIHGDDPVVEGRGDDNSGVTGLLFIPGAPTACRREDTAVPMLSLRVDTGGLVGMLSDDRILFWKYVIDLRIVDCLLEGFAMTSSVRDSVSCSNTEDFRRMETCGLAPSKRKHTRSGESVSLKVLGNTTVSIRESVA